MIDLEIVLPRGIRDANTCVIDVEFDDDSQTLLGSELISREAGGDGG